MLCSGGSPRPLRRFCVWKGRVTVAEGMTRGFGAAVGEVGLGVG